MKKEKNVENNSVDILPIAKKYTKDQIVGSKKFSNYSKDVLMAILKKDCLYSIDEAEKMIKSFLERKV